MKGRNYDPFHVNGYTKHERKILHDDTAHQVRKEVRAQAAQNAKAREIEAVYNKHAEYEHPEHHRDVIK